MEFSRKLRRKGELALLATTLIWGSSFVFAKIILDSLSPVLYLVSRCIISVLIMLLIFPKEIIFNFKIYNLKNGFLLGIPLTIGLVLQNYGIQLTTASKSAFLTSLMIVFTPIFQIIILRKKPTVGNFIGIFLVLIGSFIMTNPENSNWNIGDLLNICGAVLFGLYIVMLDIISKKASATQLSFYQIMSSVIIGSILLPFENLNFQVTNGMILNLFYLAVFGTVIAIWVQSEFQKYTTPTRAVVIFSIEPVIATIFASIILSEAFSSGETFGAVFIFGGLLISELWESIINIFNPKTSVTLNE